MRKSNLAIAVCLLLSGFVVVGCGGGSDDATTEGAAGGANSTAAGGNGEGAAGEAGGAGGSGESQGSEGAPSVQPASGSKAEFVAKANQLCEKRQDEIQKQANKLFSPKQGGRSKNEQAIVHGLVEDAIVPGLEGEIADLQGLGAPEGDEDKLTALIEAIEAVVAEANEDPVAFMGNSAAFAEPSKLARAYGVDTCGTPS